MAQPHNNLDPADETTATSCKPMGSEASYGGAPQSISSNTNQDFTTQAQRVANEEDDLARAIAISLQDQSRENVDPAGPSTRSRKGPPKIDSSIELILSLNNAFDALDDPAGDTAIYIGAPSQAPEQTGRDYDYVRTHFDRVHVLDSRTLRLMGEESKFTDRDLLNPTKSFRAQRRLRMEHRAALEEAERKRGAEYRFTYYVDLRPPKEDEEAIILLTELSCTRGVLNWHLAMDHYSISPLAVLGHDDYGVQIPLLSSMQQSEASEVDDKNASVKNTTNAASNRKSSINASPPPLPHSRSNPVPEYTALRHHAALEQLLQAIKGNDPKLDSAPKVWTFFALARYFGCAANERISGWITTWLYTGKNANFIQNNPEVAYRMAMGIRSPDLLKDSFSVLVGERALIEAYGEYRSEILNPLRQNVHGRKLEHLDDDERNRIDHAASSLVRRIREVTIAMCRDTDFLRKCPSYKVLENIVGENAEELGTLDSAKKTIKDYVRSRIYYVLCQEQSPIDDCHDKDMAGTLPFRSATSDTFCDVYQSLNQPMRLFTNTFWIALQRTQFETGHSNIANEGTIGSWHDNHYIRGLKELYKDDPANGIKDISRRTFDDKIGAVNRMLYRRDAVKDKGKAGIEQHLAGASRLSDHDPELETLESQQVDSPGESLGSQTEPNPPFAQELTVRNPSRTSLSRSAEEEPSPTKRRKTSEVDDTFNHFGVSGKRISFAMPPSKPELPKRTLHVPDLFQSSPLREKATPGREPNALQELSYGNPAAIKPTWKSSDSVFLHQEGKETMTLATVGGALTLRPKVIECKDSLPKNQQSGVHSRSYRDLDTATQDSFIFDSDDVSTGASGVNPDFRASGSPSQAKPLSPRQTRKNVSSDFYKSASGVGDAPGSSSKSPANTEEHPAEAEPLAVIPAKQSVGGLSSPKKYFNPWIGKWEPWSNKPDHEHEAKAQAEPVPGTINKPLQSTSGNSNRIVKQAFSNSNTPNHTHYHSSLKNTSPHIPMVPPKVHTIDSRFMLREITIEIGNICSGILYPPHLFHQTGLLPTNLFDTLFCLNENEWRYLPLWAPDGNDDGTGGVFDEMPVPNLDPASANIEAFAPGRIRRGHQDADSVMGGSDIEEINSSQAISTVGKASKLATDGTRTVMSLSSAASVINTVGDNDTVIIDSVSDADADAFSEIHVGEDARGMHSDADQAMSDLEKDLEYEDEDPQDSDEDADTINGDDPLEKEMSESLKDFVASYNDLASDAKHDPDSDDKSKFDFKDAHQVMCLLDNEGNIPREVDNWGNVIGEKDESLGKDKGKAKAQNFPHGVGELDQGLGQPLPYRERTGQAQTQRACSKVQNGRPGSDEEEEYEFL